MFLWLIIVYISRYLYFKLRICFERRTIIKTIKNPYLQRVLLFHRYTNASAGIGLWRADVTSEVACDNRYLDRLVLDRGNVLHDWSRRFLTVGCRGALSEAGLPDVRRFRRHRTWTGLFPDAATRASLGSEVYTYVHEDHDAGWDVKAAQSRVKDIPDVLRQLKQEKKGNSSFQRSYIF